MERFNFDLCNDLGNLLNRTIGMINKYFGGKLPSYVGKINVADEDIEKYVTNQIKLFEDRIDELQFAGSLEEIFKIISRTNKYIDETTPWVLAKEENKEKLSSVMYHLVENLRVVAVLLKPFMEETSSGILEQLGVKDKKYATWESIEKYNENLKDVKVIETGKPLFVRLDAEAEIEVIKEMMKK